MYLVYLLYIWWWWCALLSFCNGHQYIHTSIYLFQSQSLFHVSARAIDVIIDDDVGWWYSISTYIYLHLSLSDIFIMHIHTRTPFLSSNSFSSTPTMWWCDVKKGGRYRMMCDVLSTYLSLSSTSSHFLSLTHMACSLLIIPPPHASLLLLIPSPLLLSHSHVHIHTSPTRQGIYIHPSIHCVWTTTDGGGSCEEMASPEVNHIQSWPLTKYGGGRWWWWCRMMYDGVGWPYLPPLCVCM